jgi:asparagine synthase (glutamine-hydrolysing)
MCAILGFVSLSSKINLKKYYDCHLTLNHRGPDDEGFIFEKEGSYYRLRGNDTNNSLNSSAHIFNNLSTDTSIIFSHRRLSIIDLTSSGHQPFEFNDLILTFNGEIYNYVEIRNVLKTYGYKFFTNTDTEVVLKAYEKWGVDAFKKFNGMWALSIYDKKNRKTILSRDRLGKKPLFYSFDFLNKELFFASEMKALKFILNTTLNYNAVKKYLKYGENQNSHETFHKEIYILKPATYLIFDMDKIHISNYWDIKKKETSFSIQELENLLESSIKLRLRCDVESIAASLSGGLDSSTVVNFLNNQKNKKKLHTFTAFFPGIEDREKKIVDQTLKTIDAIPHFINPQTDDFFTDFNKMMYHQEQPVMGISVFVHYLIMKEISKYNLKVHYNGHGGDELFGGYTSHYISYISNDIIKLKINNVIKKSKNFFKIRPNTRHFILSLVKTLLEKKFNLLIFRVLNNNQYFNFRVKPTKYKSEFFGDMLKSDMYNEIKGYPLNEWLQYEDRNSMAFGIESRSPLLDYRIIEYAFNISNDIKFHDGELKYILRKLGEKKLPTSLLLRKDKQGFTSNNFFKNSNFRNFFLEYLMSPDLFELGLLKKQNFKNIRKNTSLLESNKDLWRIFNFSYWLKNHYK